MVAIILGVLTLVVLVAAFLASKYWHWAHVLVVVLLYFTTVGYLVLLARTQAERLKYLEAEHKATEQLERYTEQYDALRRGTNDRSMVNALRNQVTIDDDAAQIGGVRELEHQVRMLNRRRGRVWRNAAPQGVDRTNGQVAVRFPVATPVTTEDEALPDETAPATPAATPPLTLQVGAVVYAFEQGPPMTESEGLRQYLGEFRVLEVMGRDALLEPLDHLALDVNAAERLFNSSAPWIVYESMPADSLDLFADFSEEELRAMLPAASVEEYLRDGTPQQDDDDPARLEGLDADGRPVAEGETPVKYRYRRQPRDYAFLFQDLDKQHAELIALIQSSTADLQKIEQALQEARGLENLRQDELQKMQSDFELLSRDRQEIEQYAQSLEQQITKAKRLLDEVLADNARMVAQLATVQGDLTPVASGALDIDAL